jgi:vancomycin resistance protein YoaR
MTTVQAPQQTLSRPRPAQPKTTFSLGRFLLALLALLVWLSALAAVGSVVWYQYRHAGLIHQGVSVRGIDLSGMSLTQAQTVLEAAFDPYPMAPVTVRHGDQTWTLSAKDLGVNFDARSAAEAAFQVGRHPIAGPDALHQLARLQANLQDQLAAYRFGHEVLADEAVDRSAGLAWLEQRAREINRPTSEATLRIDGLEVNSTPSQVGYSLDVAASLEAIYGALLHNSGGAVDLAVKETRPLLADVSQAEVFVRQVLGGPVTLTAADPDLDDEAPPPSYTIPAEELAKLVSTEMAPLADGSLQVVTEFDVSPLRALVQSWAAELAREPRDAKVTFDPKTGELAVVSPSQIGRTLDVPKTLETIREAALSPDRQAVLPLTLIEPAVNMHKIDQMGIKELVAEGTSNFKGSSADRVHNIATAAAAIDNTVVPPGGVFSFNQAIGDVSEAYGYKDSLIIWGDRTAVGVGGGVCQASTTVFRAAYYGGFPIEERWNHGYVVGWYGTPGLDATIYTPTIDFKFRNTTDHHLIIKSVLDEAKGTLTFQFYGTKPPWQVEVTGPEVLKETPPPPPVYQKDASLAPGQVRQVEWASKGMDVAWRRVIRDSGGNVLQDETLKSSYTPWAAYYLVGPDTVGDAATPEATATP